MIMGLFPESVYLCLLTFGASLFCLFYWYLNSNFNYWKKRGVHFLTPEPFFGNMKEMTLLRKSGAEMYQSIYNELEGHKFGGIFQTRTPTLVLRDPDLIKTFMVKDFQHFQHRGLKLDEKRDPLTANLFTLGGPKWRILRSKLTPTFTSGKMKMMFHLMEDCAVKLRDYLHESAKNGEEMELKEVLAKFATDVIGTCAFGIQFNSLTDPNSEFRKMGKKVFDPTVASSIRRFMLLFLPAIAKILNVSIIGRDVTRFFSLAVKETVEYREKHNVVRNDFMQLLIQLKNKGSVEEEHDAVANGIKLEETFKLTDNLLAAQVFVFFLAGFETSSTTMSFCLHELAVNPDVQNRLQEEIDNVLQQYNGQITYDGIQKMEYLDKVISETLRKYPPVPNLVRRCTLNYNIPDTNVTLEKGTRVVIPVFALQRDPKYYPDPDRFDPERFTEENKAKRHHYTYLPFGEGPRICIGMRFGLLQTKIGLATLLTSYKFSVCQGTDVPPRLDPKALVTASVSGAWLKVTCRT